MIQVPSEGLEDIKKVIATLVNRIPIKLKPLPHSPGYVLGILNSISYCIWFFFYYEKLSGKRAERVTSLCFLFTNETGPAWGQTCLELRVGTAVPGLCLTSPVTLNQPLPLWAACCTSLRARWPSRSHRSHHALTRRLRFICSCIHCHDLLKCMQKAPLTSLKEPLAVISWPGGSILGHDAGNTASYFGCTKL